MGLTVIVNNMTVSHAGSNGVSTAFPDVCKTPTPGGPVPIPYPNVAMSSDLAKGSKEVTFDGKSICLKDSEISTSTGDEAGSLNGVVSQKIKGKAQFQNYSFDVKVEGKNVCRLSDPTAQNMGSMNTAAFFHMQAPAAAPVGEDKVIARACDHVKKKAKEQKSDSPSTKSANSGIIAEHLAAIQQVVDRRGEFTLYFRKTNNLCQPWIRARHAPKPHSLTAGKTIKGGMVEEVNAWLLRNTHRKEYRRCGGEAMTLLGIVMSTIEGAMRGMPHLSHDAQFPGKWITGDYDLMDVMRVGARCQRPTGDQFDVLRHELNKAMGWPGIQHGPQSLWDTTKDHEFQGEKHFDVAIILRDWSNQSRDAASRNIPAKNIAPGRAPLPLVDNALTVIAPGGSVYLDEHADYWDALACCGCRSDEQKRKGR
jgi:hypothetical protein